MPRITPFTPHHFLALQLHRLTDTSEETSAPTLSAQIAQTASLFTYVGERKLAAECRKWAKEVGQFRLSTDQWNHSDLKNRLKATITPLQAGLPWSIIRTGAGHTSMQDVMAAGNNTLSRTRGVFFLAGPQKQKNQFPWAKYSTEAYPLPEPDAAVDDATKRLSYFIFWLQLQVPKTMSGLRLSKAFSLDKKVIDQLKRGDFFKKNFLNLPYGQFSMWIRLMKRISPEYTKLLKRLLRDAIMEGQGWSSEAPDKKASWEEKLLFRLRRKFASRVLLGPQWKRYSLIRDFKFIAFLSGQPSIHQLGIKDRTHRKHFLNIRIHSLFHKNADGEEQFHLNRIQETFASFRWKYPYDTTDEAHRIQGLLREVFVRDYYVSLPNIPNDSLLAQEIFDFLFSPNPVLPEGKLMKAIVEVLLNETEREKAARLKREKVR